MVPDVAGALQRLRAAERQDETEEPFLLSDLAPQLLDVAEAAAEVVRSCSRLPHGLDGSLCQEAMDHLSDALGVVAADVEKVMGATRPSTARP